jgi:hypothetical protein
MFETDSTTVPLSGPMEILSTATSTGPESAVPLRRGQIQKRYLGVVPAVALSLLFSGASVLSDPRGLFLRESSVILGYQRPTRRRISLGEARQIALWTLLRAEERWEEFARREAAQFAALYSEAWD